MKNIELTESQIKKLLATADEARKFAYAPYSKFNVGAALLFDNGDIIAGCNVENGSYGLSICAERNAMAASVTKGHNFPLAAAIVGENGLPCPPCGACRQVLAEFNPDMYVILEKMGRPVICRLKELLPMHFSLIKEGDSDERE